MGNNTIGQALTSGSVAVISMPGPPGCPRIEERGRSVRLEWDPPAIWGNSPVIWYSVLYRTEGAAILINFN